MNNISSVFGALKQGLPNLSKIRVDILTLIQTVMSKEKSIRKENNKKEPVKNLKEKRAEKKAKQEDKKRNG